MDGFDFILISAPTLEKRGAFFQLYEQTAQFVESLTTGTYAYTHKYNFTITGIIYIYIYIYILKCCLLKRVIHRDLVFC